MLSDKINPILVRFSEVKKTGKLLGLNTVNYIFYPVKDDWFTPIFNLNPNNLYSQYPKLKDELQNYLLYHKKGRFINTITKRVLKYLDDRMWENISEVRIIPHQKYNVLFTTLDVLKELNVYTDVVIDDNLRVLYSHVYLKRGGFHKNNEEKAESITITLLNLWTRPITFWSQKQPFLTYTVKTFYGSIKILTPLHGCDVRSKKNVITLKELMSKFLKNAQTVDECTVSYYTGDRIIHINGAVYYYHGLIESIEKINDNLKFETEIVIDIKELNKIIKEQLPIYYEAFKKHDVHHEFTYDYEYFANEWGLPVGKCVELGKKYVFPLIVLKNPDEVKSFSTGVNSYIKFNIPDKELMNRLVLAIINKKDLENAKIMCNFYSLFI